MIMAEIMMEIRVRSLNGESIIVSISPERNVNDLNLMLKESFAPAKKSSNFQLFFKGSKMRLESQIGTHTIDGNDFVVLIPFTKKHQIAKENKPTEKNQDQFKLPNKDTASMDAKSAWSDMMHDLSYLSESSRGDHHRYSSGMPESSTFHSLNSKRQHKRGPNFTLHSRFHDALILKILCSYSKSFLDEGSSKALKLIMESMDCLFDVDSGKCVVTKEPYLMSMTANDMEKSVDTDKKCACPLWLKTTLKNFAFLNIFSGFLQLYHRYVTWNHLKASLEQLASFGSLGISIKDIENLSVLCPKLIVLCDQENGMRNLGDTISIVDSPLTVGEQSKCTSDLCNPDRKHVSCSAIMNTIRKRNNSFRMCIWKAFKSIVGLRNPREARPFLASLDDFLIFMKTSANQGGHTKRNKISASCSHVEQNTCRETNELSPEQIIEHLERGIGSSGQIVHVEEIKSREAVHSNLSVDLLQATKAALGRLGIFQLYNHQAECIDALLSGKNVVVATSTSSGKSLCYNLPILEVMSQDSSSCALYLFPTKALAQDQLRSLLSIAKGLEIKSSIGIYDGDTSEELRLWLRHNGRLVITNPDMLHVSVLPFHGQFQRFLSNLRFIVIDETHVYKGAFGSHTALILRRLRRICSHVYGSDPSLIFCTATSSNPREHAMKLGNLQNLELVQNDGSPCGQKFFVLWNPPLYYKKDSKVTGSVNNYSTKRSSSILEASRLFAEMIQHGLRCLTFCKTRKLSELVLCYTREILQETAPQFVDSVCVYRAGYTVQDRRRLETDLFSGKLLGVAATSALELGIDVGHIDATIHLGFPGSVSSLWQQAGRSGRREKPSLAVYIAFESPLDQYFMKFPEKLFGSPIERCQLDADNPQVLEQHVACAALEHPLNLKYDEKYFGPNLESTLETLTNKGCLSCASVKLSTGNIWRYIGHEKKPWSSISIRAIETEKYKVIDKTSNEVIDEIEESKAFFQVYEGAVFLHQGKTYLVKALDLSEKTALCQEADLKYYTKTRDYTDVHVIAGDIAYPLKLNLKRTTAQTHACKVTTNWFGFYRIWKRSNEIFDTVNLCLPSFSYQSQATWIQVPQLIKEEIKLENLSFRGGLHAASHALLNVVPLYVMCNSSDMGAECANPYDKRYFSERILVYDRHPGGIGISIQVQELFPELLVAAFDLLTTCCCTENSGCPSCVQITSCDEYNEVLDKKAAIIILKGVIKCENDFLQET